jgi:hypothetical protein
MRMAASGQSQLPVGCLVPGMPERRQDHHRRAYARRGTFMKAIALAAYLMMAYAIVELAISLGEHKQGAGVVIQSGARIVGWMADRENDQPALRRRSALFRDRSGSRPVIRTDGSGAFRPRSRKLERKRVGHRAMLSVTFAVVSASEPVAALAETTRAWATLPCCGRTVEFILRTGQC